MKADRGEYHLVKKNHNHNFYRLLHDPLLYHNTSHSNEKQGYIVHLVDNEIHNFPTQLVAHLRICLIDIGYSCC